MAVRARWGIEGIAEEAGDPFQERQLSITGDRIEEVGDPIDLSDRVAALSKRLIELTEQERNLFSQGVICDIKDRSDTSCNACPARGRYGDLCEIGLQQERVSTEAAVLRGREPG